MPAADDDVSELRAHTQALNALRETQLKQGRKLDDQGQELGGGFSTLVTGIAQITVLLTNRSSEGLE